MASAITGPFSTLYAGGLRSGDGTRDAVEQLGASLREDVATLTAEVRAVLARIDATTLAVAELVAAYEVAADAQERRSGQ